MRILLASNAILLGVTGWLAWKSFVDKIRKSCSSRKGGIEIFTSMNKNTAFLAILSIVPATLSAQNCIPLSGSKLCPAFPDASIATTNSSVVSLFPFLKYVSDAASFDEQLRVYLSTAHPQQKYQTLFGCNNIDLANTKELYARFTTTVMCNAIIQNSKIPCNLSNVASRPVCAETCAQQAESESIIVANHDLCPKPNMNVNSEIRADFTNCALPANSLTSSCIEGISNEPNNCGFGNSTVGLCQYCAAGGLNSTDTCCYNSDVEKRCANVVLPTITGFVTFITIPPTLTATPALPSATRVPPTPLPSELSPGAVAGIAIGSIFGLALMGAVIFLFISCLQRRKTSQAGSIFHDSSPSRYNDHSRSTQSGMKSVPLTTTPEGYEILPGGRIARMSALEGHTALPSRTNLDADVAPDMVDQRLYHQSSSDELSTASNPIAKVLRPPATGRRTGSLTSNSVLGQDDPQSPTSGSGCGGSSPQGPESPQSEQLPYFKDYYSMDQIRPGDKVSTLWAYQPRAPDEFTLERGDMLKVSGIWDDGWATGVMISEKADEWGSKRNIYRDSGVSNTCAVRDNSPSVNSEIKAFPLVCVCLPDHWRRTIEGDGSTES
ncbi:hypothetical protein K3495_g502 [Podosphaera aphanis]|nr:hypothetical protein K3495_g502 [Podosphaera aphanis]